MATGIINFKKFISPQPVGGHSKRNQKSGALGTYPVCPLVKTALWLTLEILNFVHRSAIRSLSLVMSECSLSGRGQGHMSNFYIVNLENFAIASS